MEDPLHIEYRRIFLQAKRNRRECLTCQFQSFSIAGHIRQLKELKIIFIFDH